MKLNWKLSRALKLSAHNGLPATEGWIAVELEVDGETSQDVQDKLQETLPKLQVLTKGASEALGASLDAWTQKESSEFPALIKGILQPAVENPQQQSLLPTDFEKERAKWRAEWIKEHNEKLELEKKLLQYEKDSK